ncbi:MAG TPA: nucleotidyltransferase family protein [Dongiaceae bacterium]|jgi:hypothetical protein
MKRRSLDSLTSLTAILHLGSDRGPGAEQQARLAQAIEEGGIDWEALMRFAQQHLLAPALWSALLSKKLTSPVPDAMRVFLARRLGHAGHAGGRHYLLALEEDHHANIARNADIRRQAMGVISILNAVGIEPAALKGTRVILAGESPFAGARMLRDIDLVVPGDGWDRAQTALGDAGYRRVGEAAHAVGFTHPAGAVELDLHRRPLSLHQPLPLPDYLTEEGFWGRTERLDLAGAGCRQLPRAENLVHLILHTEIADLNFAAGDWALRYLYETAVITRAENNGLDWGVLERLAVGDLHKAMKAHLYAARRLFGAMLPAGFAEDWAQRRHYLRCRANARHPRSIRRIAILVYKLRQAMAPWYLANKGFYQPARGDGLGAARLRAIGTLLRNHLRHLPRLLLGGGDSGIPPPRV